MRYKRIIFIILFILFVVFVLFNIINARNEFQYRFEDPSFPKPKLKLSNKIRRPTTQRYSLLEKSVMLRYGDTDELRILSAYSYKNESTVILKSYGYMNRRVYCRYYDNSSIELLPSAKTTVFPNFIVHCPFNKNAVKIGISIDSKDKIDNYFIRTLTKREDPKFFFSICLAPLFGSAPKWLHLLEFIEYYKLQGAEHFYVYVKEVTDVERKILKSYGSLIEIIELDNETACLSRHRCRHEVQLQDCVYRARQHSNWIATIDLDERITVSESNTIAQFLKANTSPSIAEFRFRCQWILRYDDIPTNYTQEWSSELPMIKWSNTSHIAPVNHTSKSIIYPVKVDSMGVHQVLRFLNNSTVKLARPEDGVVRHYRLQEGWSQFLAEVEEFGEFKNTTINKSLLKNVIANLRAKINNLVKEHIFN